jgi:POT family proton-dependent oligopeptide transporter
LFEAGSRAYKRDSMSSSPPDSAKRSSLFDHPLGFWFLFWGELAERCCYYGMRAILLLYMLQILEFTDGKANRIQSYFMAACYILPLVGGYVADKFLGKYRTIVYFAIPYIFGQVLLGIASLHSEFYLYWSLALLAMGSGVIKPNLSTLMGLTYDQQRPGKSKLRSDAFAMFYGSINIGAAISSFCVPWIRNHYGSDSHAYAVAFLFPAALMVLAFIVFALGKPFYATETISRVRITSEERHARMVVLRRIFGLFFVITIFWSLFDQAASTWILFARDHLRLQLFAFPLSPDQLQTLNPVLIILLLPPVTMLWHLLARFGFNLRPTSKMLIGFVLTTITMAITAWAAFRGADAMTAGASAAMAGAEKTVAAIAASADDVAVGKAVEELIAAVAGECAGEEASDNVGALGDAKSAMETAHKMVQAAGPKAVAVVAAKRAATASVRVAKFASAISVAQGGSAKDKAIAETGGAQKVAQTAAKATKVAVDWVTLPAKGETAGDAGRAQLVTADCSTAANRAEAAAAAAIRSVEAAAAGNARAAQVNAAVASVDAADAAVAAARAAANIRGVEPPAVIAETEEAAAAARISLLWQVIPYILITMAEICISVVGLELAFAAAPASMKGFVTGCWFFTVFCGDIINAQITPLYNETFWGISLTPDWYFLTFALLMVPVTVAFAIVARRFNRPAA